MPLSFDRYSRVLVNYFCYYTLYCLSSHYISCKEPTANFRNQCNLQISYLLADCSDYITDMRDLIVDYQCNMSI